MLKLHCTATSQREKTRILNDFKITPENNPEEFEIHFNDAVIKQTIEELNAGGTDDVKVLIRKIIENGGLAHINSEEYSLEDYLLMSFGLLFIEAALPGYNNVKAEDLNMNQMRLAERDFFLTAAGQSVNSAQSLIS